MFIRKQWTDGENKYNVTNLSGTALLSNVRFVYTGTGGTALSAGNFNNIETGIEQSNLFALLLTPGRYKLTKFDYPEEGIITEEIRLTSDNSLYATFTTQFDTPTAGDIQTSLTCTDLGIETVVTTEFDAPEAGQITETCEVIE